MTSKQSNTSRVLFCVVMVIQAFVLAKYPVIYVGGDAYYGSMAAFSLALIAWIIALCRNELIDWLFTVWFLYTLALVTMIGIIFGGIVMDTELGDDFFGANVLKTTLSVVPAEMLLLLNSVTDKAEILTALYFTAALDLFDGLEMLEVLLQDHQKTDDIPNGMEIAILVVVCAFFLFSCMELYQINSAKNEIKSTPSQLPKPAFLIDINSTFQIFVNICFLVFRLVLWFGYKRDAAIFIAKNLISLVYLILRATSDQSRGQSRGGHTVTGAHSNQGLSNI